MTRSVVLGFVGMLLAASQVLAMAEYDAPFLEQPLTRGGSCGEGDSYILEGEVAKGVRLQADISMTAVLTDGRRMPAMGTPLFVFARDPSDMDRGRILSSPAGEAVVPGRGFIRILAQEEQAPPPEGVDHYEDYRITVCPQ